MKSLLLTLSLTISAVANAHDSNIHLKNCVIQAAIPGSEATGAFLDIKYSGEGDKALLAAKADDISKMVEIHEMSMVDGVMKMQKIDKFDLKKGTNKLEKGGYHIMLMQLENRPQAGETYPLTLIFDGEQTETCDAVVKLPDEIKMAM